eukprot:scaffold245040_cov17-Tisochrysis_lutea.AAC.1
MVPRCSPVVESWSGSARRVPGRRGVALDGKYVFAAPAPYFPSRGGVALLWGLACRERARPPHTGC